MMLLMMDDVVDDVAEDVVDDVAEDVVGGMMLLMVPLTMSLS